MSSIVSEKGGGSGRTAAYEAIESHETKKKKKSRKHRYEMLRGWDCEFPESEDEWEPGRDDPIDAVDPEEPMEELEVT